MSDTPRYTVNRSIVTLRYQQPFLDWLMSADPDPLLDLALADLENDSDAFLIPGDGVVDNAQDAVKWVEKRWRMFFDHMLGEWLLDESLWPQKRTLKMFREWFTVEYRSMVWDLVSAPIMVYDWEDENDDNVHDHDEILH